MKIFTAALDWLGWESLSETKKRHEELKALMAKTAAELAAEITAAGQQTRKGIDEVLAKIKSLEDIIAAGGDLSAIETAVADLKVTTQALDDIVPDATPPADPA
jgi:type II secretory ATPase GspE/PulE/Tfp pilus assembly ATPase PilB-like protein